MDDDPGHISSQKSNPLHTGGFSVTSWNVNSVNARMGLLSAYLDEQKPDFVLLQEIKTQDFPALEMRSQGYFSIAKGQKAYNGVAIMSKHPITMTKDALPAFEGDDQARFVEAKTDNGLILISVYVPNGQAGANDKEPAERLVYKIKWLRALERYVQSLLEQEKPFILGGDFNVIEKDGDVYNPKSFEGSVFTKKEVRQPFRNLSFMGLTNTLKVRSPSLPLYSYWDYQAGAFSKNNGILLDHIFVTPSLADRLDRADVHVDFRGREKASDHAPVWCSFV